MEEHLSTLEDRVTSVEEGKADTTGFITIEGEVPVAGLYETFG